MRSEGNVSRAVAGTDGNPRVSRSPQAVTTSRRPQPAATARPVAAPPRPLPSPALVAVGPSEEEWRVLDEYLADVTPAPTEPPATPTPAPPAPRVDEDLAAERARVARRSFDRGATVGAIAADLGLRPMGVHNLLAGRPVSAPP